MRFSEVFGLFLFGF